MVIENESEMDSASDANNLNDNQTMNELNNRQDIDREKCSLELCPVWSYR